MTEMIMGYRISNPNFIPDVIRFLNLPFSESEVDERINDINNSFPLTTEQQNAGELTIKERLQVFIDRVEFIAHLQLLAQLAERENFHILGREVVGVHWDIRALRIYLALTCVDIIRQEAAHKDRFKAIFTETTPEIQRKWKSNVTVSSTNSKNTELDEIAEYLYNIRNYYTHAGKRFHVFEASSAVQMQDFPIGTMKHKETKILMLAPDFNLIDNILELVVFDIKKLFGWTEL